MSNSLKPYGEHNKIVKENQLDFLYDLYSLGVELSPENLKSLQDSGRIEPPPKLKHELKSGKDFNKVYVDNLKSKENKDADDMISIISEMEADIPKDTVVEPDEFERVEKSASYEGGRVIKKEDWMPADILDHTQEFIAWIDSINSGFQRMVRYKKFELYIQQAKDWCAENGSIFDCSTREEKIDYAYREFDRMEENSLYFLNKYLKIKEADLVSGKMDYDSKPVHEVIAYLWDAGYSTEVGKARQIAATTTYGGLALCKCLTSINFFIKYVAQDDKKVQEIFEDKIKYPLSELPKWMMPSVSNERDNLLKFSRKKKKGSKEGLNTRIEVIPPSVDAINGGAPNVVMIDEAGYIKILGKMIREGRPTLFREVNGKLKMIRQIVIWGTGGEMDKGGKSYEVEYMETVKKWKERQYKYGIIPLFFDWTTRPGITREFYEQEKLNYTSDGPDKEEKMVQFRQTYPSSINDMFLTSHKTLVSINYIQDALDRILNLKHEHKAIRGYFEPIFDTASPSHENDDVPYKIIDVDFIPCDDSDRRASAYMFLQPKKNWIYRYCAGTDPIATDNGFSNMAKTIWDRYYKTPACIVDYRDSNHKYTFLQCMLAGMYYKSNHDSLDAITELCEANIGTAYFDYLENKGIYRNLIQRTELPSFLDGGAHLYGIDKKGVRSKMIVNKLFELIQAYGGRIWIDVFYEQLRTFVCRVSEKGVETWGPIDKRVWKDDVLDSTVYSYICDLVLESQGRMPKEIKNQEDMTATKYVLIRRPDGMLDRVPQKVKRTA